MASSEITMAEFRVIVEKFTERQATAYILGEDTDVTRLDLQAVVKAVGILRKFHDETAIKQGNTTIRGQKDKTEKVVSEDEARAKILKAMNS